MPKELGGDTAATADLKGHSTPCGIMLNNKGRDQSASKNAVPGIAGQVVTAGEQ